MSYWTDDADVRFYYQDRGKSVDGRPTVILLSTWGIDSTTWERHVPVLVERGYRCVALDRRGHGRSDEPGTGYDLDSLADDVAGLVEHLDLGSVVVVGHSMGGCEAVRYARRHPDHTVRGVVLASSPAPNMLAAIGRDAYEQVEKALRADRAAWITDMVESFYDRPDSGVSGAQARDTVVAALRIPVEALIACYHAGNATDVTADLQSLAVPALVIHGDRDQVAPLEITGRRTADLIPDARLSIYEGAVHGLPATHTEQLVNDLLTFLEQVSGDTAP